MSVQFFLQRQPSTPQFIFRVHSLPESDHGGGGGEGEGEEEHEVEEMVWDEEGDQHGGQDHDGWSDDEAEV